MSEIIYSIKEMRQILFPIFSKYDVSKAILFGSYAKGCADSKSDVDILVDSKLRGLQFVELLEDVRTVVGKEVDLFDVTHIDRGTQIEREIVDTGVMIYEK